MPSSQIPTPSAVQRNIKKKKYSSTVRNQIADELNAFLELDKINHTNLKESLDNNKKKKLYMSSCSIFGWKYFNCSIFVDGIPLFMLRIHNKWCFETFHYGVKCYITSLLQNRTNTWSKLEEIIQYLNSLAFYHKKISWVNNF